MFNKDAIPIFDCLTHPTIDGNWIQSQYNNMASIVDLQTQMEQANVHWAFVVGMNGIGSYNESAFVEMFKESSDNKLYPIAYYTPDTDNIDAIREHLNRIKKRGYKGIKLHPRMSNFYFSERIAIVIKSANDLGLICLLCTYPYCNNFANKITPESTMELLSSLNGAKVMLLHSGAVRLMEYIEIARAFNNVLLDLSFTICKYKGSSVDLDISFAFKYFDKRICIGSDFPTYSLMNLRERFEYFSSEISTEKRKNIAYGNIISFCEL